MPLIGFYRDRGLERLPQGPQGIFNVSETWWPLKSKTVIGVAVALGWYVWSWNRSLSKIKIPAPHRFRTLFNWARICLDVPVQGHFKAAQKE